MRKFILAAAALATVSTAAYAAVTFDPATGTGFVGKGDVQMALGYNNKQLQDNAAGLEFSVTSQSVTSWTCTKLVTLGNGGVNEIIQLRAVTTSTEGLLSSVARERNQITGFNLTGYKGNPTVETEGDTLNSCPANPSGFTFDADSVVTNNTGNVLSVNGVPLT